MRRKWAVSLDEKLAAELDQLCRENGISRAGITRRALRYYLAAQRMKAIYARLRPFAGQVPFPGGEEPLDSIW